MADGDAIDAGLAAGDNAVAAGRLVEAAQSFRAAVAAADEAGDARIIRGLHGLGYALERLGRTGAYLTTSSRESSTAEVIDLVCTACTRMSDRHHGAQPAHPVGCRR